ncbi:MAG: hypothetical protein ACJ8F7_04475 [Gemmataceae bacterium]
MVRRAFWLVLLLAATELSSGCCWCNGCCHRPFFFRRWNAACSTGTSCCGGADAAPFHADYTGQPPLAPSGPMMPPATTLSRR